jgi:hypothetical protein
MMKLRVFISFATVQLFFSFVSDAHAQFWHVLPPISDSNAISAGFSNDQKKVFFIRKDAGVANVWSAVILDKYGGIIAGSKNPPVQITKFTDRGVVRFFHLLNRPEFVYMRAMENGQDFHIYRMKDDGSEQPQDLTPGGEGVTNIIIGASNNGRYVYYTNNVVHHDKVDVYRYDTQQFTSDLIFPNDKDYQALAWTRGQNKLLIEDSSAHTIMYYDIETTDRTPFGIVNGKITDDQYGPSGIKLSELALKPVTNGKSLNDPSSGSNDVYDAAQNAILSVDYSPNGKFEITHEAGKWLISDAATGSPLTLPDGACPIAIAPKEAMLVYLNGSNLYLYDIAKNVSTELAAVR